MEIAKCRWGSETLKFLGGKRVSEVSRECKNACRCRVRRAEAALTCLEDETAAQALASPSTCMRVVVSDLHTP